MDSHEMRVLAERAKELECLYAVDEVLQNRTLALPHAMQQLTELIPGGFSNPEAARAEITLWHETYATADFAEAEVLYAAPILIEGQQVGAVAAGYIGRLLDEACQLLDYEQKLLDSIAWRISQLALERQRELTLLLHMLRQIDPDMLLRIGEKLRVHLEHTAAGHAEELFGEFKHFDNPAGGEVNVPTASAPAINAEALARKLVEGAATYLSHDTVFSLLNEWIHEERVLAFVKTVDRKDATITNLLDAVRKYTGASWQEPDAGQRYTQTETWLISELTHRFLSSDEHLINRVLDNLRIPDFETVMQHIIGSERSTGNIGGKGAGIFIASQILRHAAQDDPLLQDIRTPRTWYIATDQIVDFLHYNDLEELNTYKYNTPFHLRMTYDHTVAKIKNARLPPHTMNMLRVALDDLADTPLIVRSSSLLEDRHSASFSGKYKSLFLSNQGTKQERLAALADAVLEVYSSMYNPDAIQYRKERGLLNFTEQMGVLLQEVVGRKVGPYYLPLFAGVAFSNNLLRWSQRIRKEDGLVRLVMGLGTRAVDRVNNDYPIMFAPGQPQLSINQTPDDIRHYSPQQIDLINLEEDRFLTVEASTFLRETAPWMPELHQLVSVYHPDFIETKNAFSLHPAIDDMVVTFHHTLSATPFPRQIKRMLEVLSERLQCPVDIEFAFDGEHLYLLQCRPQGTGLGRSPAPIPQNLPPKEILFTANRFISDGALEGLTHVVYVDADGYNALSSREELLAVGQVVSLLGEMLPRRKYLLMGPGRWGSRGDIKLGVRVTYADIAGTAALVEIAKEKHAYVPELSFGTHFFQDLVEANILYIPLYPDQPGVVFDEGFLLRSHNLLAELLPKYAWLSDVVKVIDIPAAHAGRTLSIHMNSELEQAVAYFTKQEPETAGPAGERDGPVWKDWPLESGQEHWQWRNYMAEQMAAALDMRLLGVKGIYLFGSTNTGFTGVGSDIDLILHVDGNGEQQLLLRQWLDGWSRALARINFLQTGYETDQLLDVHLVTDADIAAGNSFALKIQSVTDPATLLRLRDE